jgi:hypothetical protein
MAGTHWLQESGSRDGPVLITNTHSVGVVRYAFIGWLVKNRRTPGVPPQLETERAFAVKITERTREKRTETLYG